MNNRLEFYDTIERLAIRDSSMGGIGIQLILHGELDTVYPVG